MGLDFLPNSIWNIHTHTHTHRSECVYVVCVRCDELRRKYAKASCQQDLGSLADGLSVRLADIRQHSLKVFSEPYQVVFISWSEMEQARGVFLSRCQSSPRTQWQQQRQSRPVQKLSCSGSSVSSIDRQTAPAANCDCSGYSCSHWIISSSCERLY